MESLHILVVDDELEIADLIQIYLENEGYVVYTYYNSKSVLTDLEHLKIDLYWWQHKIKHVT